MSELFINMIFVIIYQDDILVLTSGLFDDHLRQLENVFKWLHHNNLQVNAKKSSFCALETEYLGFILMREGIKPQQQKVNAILQVAPPCNVRPILCWHAEPLQSNDSLLLPPSNTAYSTYQEERQI
jgi:hypothetical protein